ncbi:hypothetical protein [Lentilactobacillus hilgardii]|uniref:hypothetical protein n=1 Tax=Lentilactobacillus hilgardii TaxID=1588 RepID=UPI0021A3F287|nr:hypothetical protein [Lentilactobacillus hilgardii]MCP9333935.1 hypothetical protein [Lentilactobacillus hilgardii]MCP9350549.1 hypothetical protein [Lentilactobacillus hilgardii]MCP9353445.1 hypothetical protein [Lentilactobacillus hilgardii]MCT3397529.1 hypothetical protein [Lentilactobacillus hilgardii]MCT3399512.1 hypothetical protein [Lentilactobacillus hilgardii]
MKIKFDNRLNVDNTINDFFTIILNSKDEYSLQQSITMKFSYDYSKNFHENKLIFVDHEEYVLLNKKTNETYTNECLFVLPRLNKEGIINNNAFKAYLNMSLKDLKKPKYPYRLIKEDFFDKLN